MPLFPNFQPDRKVQYPCGWFCSHRTDLPVRVVGIAVRGRLVEGFFQNLHAVLSSWPLPQGERSAMLSCGRGKHAIGVISIAVGA